MAGGPSQTSLCDAAGHLIVLVAAVVVLTSLAQPKAIHSIAGPFRIVPGHVEHCPPELEAPVPIDFFVRGVRDRHNLDLWYYSGNFTTHFTWTDNHDIDVRFASWSSRGGWKENFYVFKMKHYCTAFKTYAPATYRKVMLAVNNDSNYKSCTWSPGLYHIRNLSTDVQMKAIPSLFYGKWRVDLRLMADNFKVTLGCFRGYADTVPKL